MSGTDEPGETTRDDAVGRDHAAEDGERAGTAVGVTDRDDDATSPSESGGSEAGSAAGSATAGSETGSETGSDESAVGAKSEVAGKADDDAGTTASGASGATGAGDLDGPLDDDDLDDDEDAPQRPWLTIALGVVAAAAIIALVVTTLIIPGWAVKPGSPDAVAERVSTALATKNPAELEAVSCHNQQGRATNPFPPDALQIIQSARPAGPPRLELDTQAVAPMDLTLSAQGQTQSLPADIVLAVTDGDWCMAGVSQRQ